MAPQIVLLIVMRLLYLITLLSFGQLLLADRVQIHSNAGRIVMKGDQDYPWVEFSRLGSSFLIKLYIDSHTVSDVSGVSDKDTFIACAKYYGGRARFSTTYEDVWNLLNL